MLPQLRGACSGPPGSGTGPAGAAAALPGRLSALGAHSWPPGQHQVWGLDWIQDFLFIFWWVKEEKVTRNSHSGRRIHHEPPCVTQGAGDRPGGISPPKNPLAKFAQQELPHPQGRWLVDWIQG